MINVNKNENVLSDDHFMAVCGVRTARAPAPMGPALACRLVIQIFRGNCLIVSAGAWQTGPLFCFRNFILFVFPGITAISGWRTRTSSLCPRSGSPAIIRRICGSDQSQCFL